VLLNKPPVKIEVINDISDDIVNLFITVASKDTFDKFVELLSRLPYSRSVYNKVTKMLKQPFELDIFNPDIKRVVAYYYYQNVSISGSHSFATSRVKPKPYYYFNKLKKLSDIHKRLQNVTIEQLDFEKCIQKYDTPNTLFFIDPPYLGTEYYYTTDFTIDDHKRLLQLLKNIKGKFVLTTYYNELYEHELKDFYCVTIETKIFTSIKQSEQRRNGLEYVYMNFEPYSGFFIEYERVNRVK
jgi:DNA adenine methylase